MQTFLPYPSMIESLSSLDYRRLGKQRVEAMQLINVTLKLQEDPTGKFAWMNHPARLMWVGYLDALMLYHNLAIEEWISRGYNNNMKFFEHDDHIVLPPWFGDDRFHASHRSNLLRKDPVWYGQYSWKEPDNLEYVWPIG